jgi:hypothetical protein
VTLSIPSTVHIPTFQKDALTFLDVQMGLTFSDGYSLANFFSEFISLHTLVFEFASISWSDERIVLGGRDSRSDSEVVTLPFLEKLTIYGSGDINCCIVDFWHHFRTPKLQSMSFELNRLMPIVTSSDSHSLFARFMEISQCSTLAIYYHISLLGSGHNLQSQESFHTDLMPYIRVRQKGQVA